LRFVQCPLALPTLASSACRSSWLRRCGGLSEDMLMFMACMARDSSPLSRCFNTSMLKPLLSARTPAPPFAQLSTHRRDFDVLSLFPDRRELPAATTCAVCHQMGRDELTCAPTAAMARVALSAVCRYLNFITLPREEPPAARRARQFCNSLTLIPTNQRSDME